MGTAMNVLALLLVVAGPAARAEEVTAADFGSLAASDLSARVEVSGDNLRTTLEPSTDGTGVQVLALAADLDPTQANWNHIAINLPRRIRNAEALNLRYRGDRAQRLYVVLVDSRGQRGDATIGEGVAPREWSTAHIPLRNLNVPNGTPPNDRVDLVDVSRLELYPYAASYPGAGSYRFEFATISISRAPAPALPLALDVLAMPVANGGFEELTPDGAGFSGWGLSISREAKVSVSVSREVRHGGRRSVCFHNESALSAHVYGRFSQTVAVQPSTAYRLSCWVKGKDARSGNHWTDWKSYTLNLPYGDFDWQQVETRFTTGGNQTSLDLGLNVVNVAEALWIDDVQLTTDMTQGHATGQGAKMAIWAPTAASAERDELPVRIFWQGMPEDGGEVRLELRQGAETVLVADEPWTGAAGASEFYLQPEPSAQREHKLVVSLLDAAGSTLATAERETDLMSSAYVRARVDKVTVQAEQLEALIARWREQGLPVDYPMVTRTVTREFLPWIEEDVRRMELPRAVQQLDELDGILAAAISECQNPPPPSAITAPRYVTSPVTINGGHFESQVRWPDGTVEQRPVFFNGYGHFTAVRRDLEKMPDYGLNIIQVEMGPEGTVQPDLSINLDAARDNANLMRRGEAANVMVNLLLSPHYFPGWAYEKWPEIGGVSAGFARFDVDNPHTREVLAAYLRGVVPELAPRPGLHSFCLTNEPIYQGAGTSVYNLAAWHEWLRAKHGTIEELNVCWGSEYDSFDEIPVEDGGNLSPRPELYDWVSFNDERFAGWHRWMADIIHETTPQVPVHAKIMNLPFNRGTLGWGNDVELFDAMGQIAGNDNYNNYIHEPDAEMGNGWLWANQYLDLLRSGRGQPSFNSENHVVADRNWAPVPGMHMRNLIWQAAIHGQGASTMWVWERTYEPSSDFAGSVMHRPAFCDAHGRAALDLMRLAPEVVAIQDAPARVAVVYSRCAMLWHPNYVGISMAAYEALTNLGEKVDFITWRQLERGEGARYQVVVAPRLTHFESAGYANLEQLSALPGHRVVLVGEGPAHDEYGRERDISGLKATVVAEGSARDLVATLPEAMGLDQPVRVVDAETSEPVWGVGYRWAREGDGWLVNVCNYLRKPVKVRIEGPRGAQRNLFTQMPLVGALELQGMEPALVRIGG